MAKIFIDSNVWIYLFAHEDNKKAKRSEEFILSNGLAQTFVISYQVINEVSNVLKKKGVLESQIREIIERLSKICVIQEYSKDIALFASSLRESNGFSFWDSHIVAAAIFGKCNLLVSEDMQSGQVVNGVQIRDIFID